LQTTYIVSHQPLPQFTRARYAVYKGRIQRLVYKGWYTKAGMPYTKALHVIIQSVIKINKVKGHRMYSEHTGNTLHTVGIHFLMGSLLAKQSSHIG